MYQQCNQDEDVPMMPNENNTGTEKFPDPDDLSFTWFLIKAMQQIRKFRPPNYTLLQRNNFSYYAQLSLVFVLFLVAIVIGAVFLNQCQDEQTICLFLIVHGVCGIVVVLVHIAVAFIG